MALSKPLAKIAQEQGINPTPAGIKTLLIKLKNQNQNWKKVATICGVSTKSLRMWRDQLGIDK